MDLDIQPVEQAVTRQRLVVKWRTPDLAKLDRITAHTVARSASDECRRSDRRSARTDRARHMRLSADRARVGAGLIGPRERYGPLARRVNHGKLLGPGHGPNSARQGSPAD
jgi:hypothetical protein